jgi:isorenieratene synthase
LSSVADYFRHIFVGRSEKKRGRLGRMNRRRFLATSLKAAAFGGGAFALGVGGGLAWVQPRRHVIAGSDGLDRARERKRVVVVGGGLAGLVAALELAPRNFDVTLVERAPALGGKLGGWPVRALGEEFPVEHGFHGFFSQYYNLNEVLAAAGVGDDLVESPGYPVLFGDRPPETFGKTTRVFPFNMLSVVAQSRSLRLGDFRHDGSGLYDLMRFDGERTFERFDNIDFARFCRERGINRPMVETVLEPFGKTTLNRLDRLSAAEAIRFFHFYFMGNPEGLGFRYLRRDSMTAVIDPLRRRLESLGGRVRTGTAVRRLVRERDRVSRVIVDADGAAPPPARRHDARLPERGFLRLQTDDGGGVFIGRRSGRAIALDGRCTHMGCPVAYDEAADTFRCPCHGGAFDGDGRPTAGPPVRALATLPLTVDGDELVVGGGAAAEESLACDYCVVACEVRGLQRLITSSDLDWPYSLGEADPYVVWRLWLDKATLPSRNAFYTTAQLGYTDSIAIYSAFQEPYVSWARRTGGSVVEVHAYAIRRDTPPTEIRARMRAELWGLLPELYGARVLHEEYQQQDNFTRWAPGDHAHRPPTQTQAPNLFLAGDYVKLPAPAALMEAAAMSGRLAANGILRAEGVRQVPIPTVALKGPLV